MAGKNPRKQAKYPTPSNPPTQGPSPKKSGDSVRETNIKGMTGETKGHPAEVRVPRGAIQIEDIQVPRSRLVRPEGQTYRSGRVDYPAQRESPIGQGAWRAVGGISSGVVTPSLEFRTTPEGGVFELNDARRTILHAYNRRADELGRQWRRFSRAEQDQFRRYASGAGDFADMDPLVQQFTGDLEVLVNGVRELQVATQQDSPFGNAELLPVVNQKAEVNPWPYFPPRRPFELHDANGRVVETYDTEALAVERLRILRLMHIQDGKDIADFRYEIVERRNHLRTIRNALVRQIANPFGRELPPDYDPIQGVRQYIDGVIDDQHLQRSGPALETLLQEGGSADVLQGVERGESLGIRRNISREAQVIAVLGTTGKSRISLWLEDVFNLHPETLDQILDAAKAVRFGLDLLLPKTNLKNTLAGRAEMMIHLSKWAVYLQRMYAMRDVRSPDTLRMGATRGMFLMDAEAAAGGLNLDQVSGWRITDQHTPGRPIGWAQAMKSTMRAMAAPWQWLENRGVARPAFTAALREAAGQGRKPMFHFRISDAYLQSIRSRADYNNGQMDIRWRLAESELAYDRVLKQYMAQVNAAAPGAEVPTFHEMLKPELDRIWDGVAQVVDPTNLSRVEVVKELQRGGIPWRGELAAHARALMADTSKVSGLAQHEWIGSTYMPGIVSTWSPYIRFVMKQGQSWVGDKQPFREVAPDYRGAEKVPDTGDPVYRGLSDQYYPEFENIEPGTQYATPFTRQEQNELIFGTQHPTFDRLIGNYVQRALVWAVYQGNVMAGPVHLPNRVRQAGWASLWYALFFGIDEPTDLALSVANLYLSDESQLRLEASLAKAGLSGSSWATDNERRHIVMQVATDGLWKTLTRQLGVKEGLATGTAIWPGWNYFASSRTKRKEPKDVYGRSRGEKAKDVAWETARYLFGAVLMGSMTGPLDKVYSATADADTSVLDKTVARLAGATAVTRVLHDAVRALPVWVEKPNGKYDMNFVGEGGALPATSAWSGADRRQQYVGTPWFGKEKPTEELSLKEREAFAMRAPQSRLIMLRKLRDLMNSGNASEVAEVIRQRMKGVMDDLDDDAAWDIIVKAVENYAAPSRNPTGVDVEITGAMQSSLSDVAFRALGIDTDDAEFAGQMAKAYRTGQLQLNSMMERAAADARSDWADDQEAGRAARSLDMSRDTYRNKVANHLVELIQLTGVDEQIENVLDAIDANPEFGKRRNLETPTQDVSEMDYNIVRQNKFMYLMINAYIDTYNGQYNKLVSGKQVIKK